MQAHRAACNSYSVPRVQKIVLIMIFTFQNMFYTIAAAGITIHTETCSTGIIEKLRNVYLKDNRQTMCA
jgi:hypothetical protein